MNRTFEICNAGNAIVYAAVVLALTFVASAGNAGEPTENSDAGRDAIDGVIPKNRASLLTAHFEPDGVEIREGENPVFFYQRGAKSFDGKWRRAAYVHPVYDLQGRVITEDFPEDHRHHRGIFWAWHQVWVGGKRLGDPWMCERFDWDVKSVSVSSPASPLLLESRVQWKSPDWVNEQGEMIPVVDETLRVLVHALSSQQRCIDFDLSLRALVEDVRIGGSDDVKGYGGFSPRIQMLPTREFRDHTGTLEPTKLAVMGGPWIDLRNQENGVAIMTHPSNPAETEGDSSDRRYPWILRNGRSMQNAVYPGRTPVPIGEETRLRYRLVIHDGMQTAEQLQRCYEEFATSTR